MGFTPEPAGSAQETIFYDGTCGLCHALVRFAAKRDRAGWFLFAPLAGEHFRAAVPHPPAHLPDSAAVLTTRGDLILQSTAVLHVLRQLGGGWRLLGALAGALPLRLLDWGYASVARLRRRLFAPPKAACPLVPEPIRSRFRP